jgi:hypothetical protein
MNYNSVHINIANFLIIHTIIDFSRNHIIIVLKNWTQSGLLNHKRFLDDIIKNLHVDSQIMPL